MKGAAALAAAALLVGALSVTTAPSPARVAPAEVEVRLGALAPGSTGGLNHSAGVANVTSALLSTTSHALYVNNTNATGPWLVRLELATATGLAGLASLSVGIHNGTSTVSQIVATTGTLTKSNGTLVRLEPGSANRIVVTSALSILGASSTLTMRLVATDSAEESASVATDVRLRVG